MSHRLSQPSSLYPRGESNAYRRNRNPKFYPLNYRGVSDTDAKVSIFFKNTHKEIRFLQDIYVFLPNMK